jgi:HPt (histidine-containing phosphotransfer) domain-containing protein
MSLPSVCPDDGNASIGLASTASTGLPVQDLMASAAPASSAAAPLVDPAALQDLGAQLDSPAVAKGFARDYTKMWDQRYRSLASALQRRDLAGSMDAVLSLKTSSAMVGGLRLAQLAGELEAAIRAGDVDHALSLLCDVAERGGETVDELQFSYVLWES